MSRCCKATRTSCFCQKGQRRRCDGSVSINGADACTRLVIPEYAHLDCFIGRDAARDVFLLIVRELDRLS